MLTETLENLMHLLRELGLHSWSAGHCQQQLNRPNHNAVRRLRNAGHGGRRLVLRIGGGHNAATPASPELLSAIEDSIFDAECSLWDEAPDAQSFQTALTDAAKGLEGIAVQVAGNRAVVAIDKHLAHSGPTGVVPMGRT